MVVLARNQGRLMRQRAAKRRGVAPDPVPRIAPVRPGPPPAIGLHRPFRCPRPADHQLALADHARRRDPARRAALPAQAAARALGGVHVGRLVPHLDGEVADEPRHLLDLARHHELDVRVLADLDHLRGEDAGGAVERGKGLVEHRHVAADGRLALDEEHGAARVGDVERRLDAGDTGSHH